MAFVSRSERNLDISQKVNKNVGPGSYIGHSDFKVKLL